MDKLKFINEQMNDVLAIPYEFQEWTKPVVHPYVVGEITEEPTTTEDGAEESTMILTIFHRGSEGKYSVVEELKNKIKNHFNYITGLCAKTDSGSIAVFFDGSFYIPTGEADLVRNQIMLKIKEWKGAN